MLRATIILLGFVMFASPLSAQDGRTPTFDSLMAEGLRLRGAGRDLEALALFERGHELRPASGQAIGQVAFAEMALGRLVLAEAHLIAALRAEEDAWVSRHRAALEEACTSLNARIATVEIPVEGEVTFTESGQRETRSTPVTLRLSPGRHELQVVSVGFEPSLTTLTIQEGQRVVHIPSRHPSVATATSEAVVSARPTESHGPLIDDLDPSRYLVRSIRLDVSAALFAAAAVATGLGALVTRPEPDFFGDRTGRSNTNKVLIGTAIVSGALALALFIGARAARTKHRREMMMPSF